MKIWINIYTFDNMTKWIETNLERDVFKKPEIFLLFFFLDIVCYRMQGEHDNEDEDDDGDVDNSDGRW